MTIDAFLNAPDDTTSPRLDFVARNGWKNVKPFDFPSVVTIDEVDLTRPVLALDVDGPLNRWWGTHSGHKVSPGPETVRVRTGNGDKFVIDFYPERIAELDRIVRTYGVVIAWLTTWGPNVKAIVEQAFDGHLSGGFVLKKQPPKYRGARPADWKFTGLRDHLRDHPVPWAWVDDEQIELGRTFNPHWIPELLDLSPAGLPMHVDERESISEAQLAELEAFFAEHG